MNLDKYLGCLCSTLWNCGEGRYIILYQNTNCYPTNHFSVQYCTVSLLSQCIPHSIKEQDTGSRRGTQIKGHRTHNHGGLTAHRSRQHKAEAGGVYSQPPQWGGAYLHLLACSCCYSDTCHRMCQVVQHYMLQWYLQCSRLEGSTVWPMLAKYWELVQECWRQLGHTRQCCTLVLYTPCSINSKMQISDLPCILRIHSTVEGQ